MFFNVDTKLQIGLLTQQKVSEVLCEKWRCGSSKGSKLLPRSEGLLQKYSLKHLPLDDELLQNACFLNFERRLNADVLQAYMALSSVALQRARGRFTQNPHLNLVFSARRQSVGLLGRFSYCIEN